MKRVRGLLTSVLALGLLLTSASSASADHHLMMISEVYPGELADPDEEYVEMQMWTGGQNNVGPALSVRLYDAAGALTYSQAFGSDVPNGESQRTLLTGQEIFTPDLQYAEQMSGYLLGTGGAACITSSSFGVLDCVAWGNFNDTTPTTPEVLNVGTPEPAIPDVSPISRTQARGCATLLEPADDTNDSDADFSVTDFTPRTNTMAITETPCTTPPPGGGGGSGGATTPAFPPSPPTKKCKKGQKLKKGKCVKKKRKRKK